MASRQFDRTTWLVMVGWVGVVACGYALRVASDHSPPLAVAIAFVMLGGAVGLGIIKIRYIRYVRRKKKLKQGLCPTCGYDLRATPDRCPECGAKVQPSPIDTNAQR